MDRFLCIIFFVLFAGAMASAPAHACNSFDRGGMLSAPMCDSYKSKRTKVVKHEAKKKTPVRQTRSRSPNRSLLVPQQITHGYGHKVGPRPKRWCGWWMRTQFGGGPEYNVAWNWRKRGVAAAPHVGAVVVWRHHVGMIVGMNDRGQWLVKSGNDGGAVRTRARSIKGAVIRAMV
jgi:hypothetical protein